MGGSVFRIKQSPLLVCWRYLKNGLGTGFLLCLMSMSLVACSQFTNSNSEAEALSFACEEDLYETYQTTFYPFLSKNCSACHSLGETAGTGDFAEPELPLGFSLFFPYGSNPERLEKIIDNASDPDHPAPASHPSNRAQLEESREIWDSALADYDSCLVEEE